MKKKRVAIAIIILILVIFGLLAYFSPTLKINGNTVDSSVKPAANAAASTSNSKVSASAPSSSARPPASAPTITLENFPSYLAKQNIIKELPKSAQISLVLSDVGKSYIVTTGSIVEGQVNKPDIIVTIPSKYVLDSGDFCSLVKLANSRRDLSYELKASKVSLVWKYSGMMKYKSCF
ncbi:MAG: hypothetical protein WC979_04715 [Candidatus Pacearchaeota archaeon]|jgi:hypothetical protein